MRGLQQRAASRAGEGRRHRARCAASRRVATFVAAGGPRPRPGRPSLPRVAGRGPAPLGRRGAAGGGSPRRPDAARPAARQPARPASARSDPVPPGAAQADAHRAAAGPRRVRDRRRAAAPGGARPRGPPSTRQSDAATVDTEGVEFPFPGYLRNLVAQVYQRWRPPASQAARGRGHLLSCIGTAA